MFGESVTEEMSMPYNSKLPDKFIHKILPTNPLLPVINNFGFVIGTTTGMRRTFLSWILLPIIKLYGRIVLKKESQMKKIIQDTQTS